MAFANITGSPDVVLASFAPFASLTSLAPAAARVLQLAQQPAERVNLMFIGQLLALGMFHQLQDILHLLQRELQGFDNSRHFADGLADGGTVRPDRRNGRRSGFRRRCGRGRAFEWRAGR